VAAPLDLGDWPVQPHGDGAAFQVRVQPRARRQALAGRHGASLRVQLTAPPLAGRANAALLDYLAELLGVAPGRLSVLAGARGRDKRIAVAGLSPEAVRLRLAGRG
jgi:uncharacterized protein (TIGR00251 family)